ncbi:hypothetical protein VpasPP24_109 [Vibrio phage Vpas_PP24]|nr:hypothetical protein VpasPP24_109 [Vibrio phage Vpas_PP24]
MALKDTTLVKLDVIAAIILEAKKEVVGSTGNFEHDAERLQVLNDIETEVNAGIIKLSKLVEPEALEYFESVELRAPVPTKEGLCLATDSEYISQVRAMRATYTTSRNAQAGAKVPCPVCSKELVKTSHQQSFCSNSGQGNCKDIFFSIVRSARAKRLGVSLK